MSSKTKCKKALRIWIKKQQRTEYHSWKHLFFNQKVVHRRGCDHIWIYMFIYSSLLPPQHSNFENVVWRQHCHWNHFLKINVTYSFFFVFNTKRISKPGSAYFFYWYTICNFCLKLTYEIAARKRQKSNDLFWY